MTNGPNIEIQVTCNRECDYAEADTAEGALLAARTLFDEAYARWGGCFRPVVKMVAPDGRIFMFKPGRRP